MGAVLALEPENGPGLASGLSAEQVIVAGVQDAPRGSSGRRRGSVRPSLCVGAVLVEKKMTRSLRRGGLGQGWAKGS